MQTYLVIAIVVIVALIAGIIVFSLRSGEGRIVRDMTLIPRAPIESLAEGLAVRVVGVVELAERTLTAPVTGRTCAHYSVEIWDRLERASGDSLRVVGRETKQERFVVREASGSRVVVEPTGGEFALTRNAVHVASELGTHDAILAPHGITPQQDRYEIHEQALVAGALVAVAGVVAMENGGFVLRGRDPMRLRVTDMRSARGR